MPPTKVGLVLLVLHEVGPSFSLALPPCIQINSISHLFLWSNHSCNVVIECIATCMIPGSLSSGKWEVLTLDLLVLVLITV